MTLYKLRSAPMVILEDNYNNNVLPLLKSILPENLHINVFCYEQPVSLWENFFRQQSVTFHQELIEEKFYEYVNTHCCIFIDSFNQMVLQLGWHKSLRLIKRLQENKNVKKVLVVLHKDCLLVQSKIEKHLKHISNATVSFNDTNLYQISVQLKIGNKLILSEEKLHFDNVASVLKCERITKDVIKDEPEKPSPGNLSTFKIEVDQTQQLEKNKLKLPYMSKIDEGKGKVYYEPDAVDDWDDEDPDDDLDI